MDAQVKKNVGRSKKKCARLTFFLQIVSLKFKWRHCHQQYVICIATPPRITLQPAGYWVTRWHLYGSPAPDITPTFGSNNFSRPLSKQQESTSNSQQCARSFQLFKACMGSKAHLASLHEACTHEICSCCHCNRYNASFLTRRWSHEVCPFNFTHQILLNPKRGKESKTTISCCRPKENANHATRINREDQDFRWRRS